MSTKPFVYKKIDEILAFCKSNCSLSMASIWKPILGIVFIKKMRPESVKGEEDLANRLNQLSLELEDAYPRFKDTLYKNYEKLPIEVIKKVLEMLNSEELANDGDIIGDIYNALLEKFDSGTQLALGTHYTPKSLTQLIAKVLDIEEGIVVDPAVGSGGLFLGIKDVFDEDKKDITRVQFYGTEIEESSAALGNMNLVMNNMQGGILGGVNMHYAKDPLNLVGKADFVVANPPFNQTGVKIKECCEAWGWEESYKEYMEARKKKK